MGFAMDIEATIKPNDSYEIGLKHGKTLTVTNDYVDLRKTKGYNLPD